MSEDRPTVYVVKGLAVLGLVWLALVLAFGLGGCAHGPVTVAPDQVQEN